MKVTTTNNLVHHLKNDMGIRETDLVFLFSGVWGLGILDNGLDTIHEAFEEVLPKGTLIVPTFSYSWSQGEEFNAITSCPDMGAFSNYTINKSDYIRTNNPNFSVSIKVNAFNKDLVDYFLDIGNDCFGDDSIFGKVVNYSKNNNAWILLLGGAFNDVIYRSTFIHYAQQKINVSHRYIKEFTFGTNPRAITQLVRFINEIEYFNHASNIDNNFLFPIEEDFTQYGLDVQSSGILTACDFVYSTTRMVPVQDSVRIFMDKARGNPYYCISKSSIR